MKQVEMFFDYECPYCRRAYNFLFTQLPALADIEMIWRPCEAHPRPEDHPPHTDMAIQGYYFAQDQQVDPLTYHTRLFSAVHEDHIDVEDPAVLANYVADLLGAKAFENALRSGQYQDIQQQGNDYAYEENEVWFLPAFRSNGRKLDAKGGIGVDNDELLAFLKSD